MINSHSDIVLYNKFLDTETRRELYRPTVIEGVAVYDMLTTGADTSGGYKSESLVYKIRIPWDAATQDLRHYLPEASYDKLDAATAEGYWTIHTEDLLYVIADGVALPASAYEVTDVAGAKRMADLCGYQGRLVVVTEYADNTHRGTRQVRHWRIGGA